LYIGRLGTQRQENEKPAPVVRCGLSLEREIPTGRG
jgi:hypothetical protein